MRVPQMILNSVVIGCGIVFTACGGGSSSGESGGTTTTTTTTTTTITGVAEAPGGMIAQLVIHKPVLMALIEFVFPGAYAAITGLQPVTGATVELIRIDNDGNQVGGILASTVTSITGNYSLALPSGVSLAGNLVVRISGTGGASLSAIVVEQEVNINPISQYVLSKFVDDENLVLADLSINEVVALQGKVEEFDLTATSDLSSMLAQLDAHAGELVDTEIAALNSTPDNGAAAAAAAGTWNTVDLSVGLHDSEQQSSGTLAMSVFSESLTFAASSSVGEMNITTDSVFVDAWTSLSSVSGSSTSIYHETSIDSETDVFTAQIDANGNLTLESPFEEKLQTVNTQVDTDGPDFGWRWPPSTVVLTDTGNNNTKVLTHSDTAVRYDTTDTNNDGVKDAVSPNAKSGDEVEMAVTLMLKQGNGMSVTSLDGDYGIVTMSLDLNTAPMATLESSVGVANFNAAGTFSAATAAFNSVGVERTASSYTTITLTDTGEADGNFSFPYTVTATGQVTLDVDDDAAADDTDDLQGWTNNDGSVLALLKVTTTGANLITEVYNEMMVGVKLPSTAPSMANAVYKFYPMILGADQTGMTELISLRNVSSFTFNADATSATAEFTTRAFQRATDIASIQAFTGGAEPALDFTVNSLAANGAISMTHTDASLEETITLKGFISADSKMLVLRLHESDDTVGEKYRGIGMVIGIKQ